MIRGVKKRRLLVGVAALTYFLQALQSAFKHFPPSDHNFSAYNLFNAEKERSSGLVTSQRKVANRKVRDLSNLHPDAEQLFRRICGH